MGFVERAFTPPGAGGAPPGSPANPLPMAAPLTPTPVAPPPAPPAAPPSPAPPPMFQPTQTPGQKAVAQRSASTMLGAAATAGQTTGTRGQKSILG